MIVVASAYPIDIAPDPGVEGNDTMAGSSPLNVAVALAGMHQAVGLLSLDRIECAGEPAVSFAVATRTTDADDSGWSWSTSDVPAFGSATIAVHTGLTECAPGANGLERLCVQERARAQVTVSLDLRMHPEGTDDLGAAQELALRRIRSADVVTANARDLAHLYPGVAPTVIAHYWREEGVACSAITSERDGVLLLAPNGLTYRRSMPVEPSVDMVTADGAFTAGLLAELSSIGALGSDPRNRLADVRPQQWLRVIEHADTTARSHAARAQSSRRFSRPARSARPAAWRHAAVQPHLI